MTSTEDKKVSKQDTKEKGNQEVKGRQAMINEKIIKR